jgi:hypothetical protein
MWKMGTKNKGVALMFVVLITVIIGCVFAGIGTINYIEILRVRNETISRKAKENALFALGLAVGKLQKLSGPDMRATATAAIIPGAANSKKHHTGVWDVSSGEPIFLEWLVSDKNAANFDYIYSDTPSGAVEVFSAGGTERVYVSPIEMKNKNTVVGRCGFWISDESQKIAISPVDRYSRAFDQRAKCVRNCCPQAFNLEQIFGKNNSIEGNFALTKIDFPEQLALIDPVACDIFLKNRHHLTLHSYGVLSDSKNGGLRKDLSRLAKEKPKKNEHLFAARTEAPSFVPTLNFLLSYFDLSDSNSGNQIGVSATEPMPLNGGLQADSAAIHGIYPVLAQGNVNIGVANIGGTLAVTITPQVLIWNPYNVELRQSDYSVEFGVLCENPANAPGLQIIGFDSEIAEYVQIGIFPLAQQLEQNSIARILKLNFTANLRPGEVKMFSLKNSQQLQINDGNNLANIDSIAGYAHIDCKIQPDKYNQIKVICSSADGRTEIGWDRFYWRLIDGKSGKILQEISELSPTQIGLVSREIAFLGKNTNCFSLCSRMRYGTSGDASSARGVRWLANCNPRAQCVARAWFQRYTNPFLGQNSASENWNFYTSLTDSETPIRLDNAMVNYLSNLILFDVPDNLCGILNIAHLRHVNFIPFGYFSSQIFGSSRANPMIPIAKTFYANSAINDALSPANGINLLYDYSYLLNEAIFDKYFISTEIDGAAISENLNFLVNRRFKFTGSKTSRSSKNPAEFLLIHGAFNVNSCSSIAWQCALSAAKNGEGEATFPRFYPAQTSTYASTNIASFRSQVIKKLAENLVNLICKRSKPFAGIGDFVNRTISPNPSLCTKFGILQQAIDESGINSASEKNYINSTKGIAGYDDDLASGYLGENLPDVVNQGDILQIMAHFLCTRGDTFLVRAFGDCIDGGKVAKRAHCEAIVQRIPEYINCDENSPSSDFSELSTVNKKFGRRYKIILFRWLNGDDF